MTADTDVVIAGLGPTGAVLAGLLAQWGVRSVVVERDREVYRQPRAAHFDGEIMRVFQQLGIADDLLPHTRILPFYEFRNAAGQVLMHTAQDDEDGPQGWRRSYMFHQPAMEELLRAKLAGDPRVRLRLGESLTGIARNDAGGVRVSLAGEELSARFLVGCDGGGSTVRKLSAIDLFDFGFDEPWLVIDTLVADESGLPEGGVQLCDPARPTTVMPMAPGRRRWEFMLRPGEQPQDMLDDAVIARLLAPWLAPGAAKIVRKAVYRFHGVVATRWRDGSVLLAGDAAHQMPPFMGQGMCSGVRDAAALAWRLGMILRHGAEPALLDSYQAERDPQVRAIVAMAIAMGRVVCTQDEALAAARDRDFAARGASEPAGPPGLPPLMAGFLHPSPKAGELFPQPTLDGVRFDAIAGHRFSLVARDTAGLAAPAPIRVVAARGALTAWLDENDCDAVLIRPDRYIFGTGTAQELLRAAKL
ncbi:MAG: bifunctional 3-(3-hydroxy-phenyl)propionate/3-hydroxycinnamic acid hydroxylase [Rhizomicrobium sp.]